MIHQWFINSKSLNHEMWFFFKERHLYKFGWILQKVSAYLTSFAFSLQLLWKWTKLLNFKFWFNFLSKAHVPSRLWVNAYIREVCGWKFDQMDDPSIQMSTLWYAFIHRRLGTWDLDKKLNQHFLSHLIADVSIVSSEGALYVILPYDYPAAAAAPTFWTHTGP